MNADFVMFAPGRSFTKVEKMEFCRISGDGVRMHMINAFDIDSKIYLYLHIPDLYNLIPADRVPGILIFQSYVPAIILFFSFKDHNADHKLASPGMKNSF